jgi:hypothetical protein
VTTAGSRSGLYTETALRVPRLSERQSAVALGVALFASYAYFYQAGGWNQNARFALVRAILERHTLQIDAYQGHTGDKALWLGHYYSDKAPGASLLALGPVAVAREISRLAHVDPEGSAGIAWTSYVATVVTSGLFTVVAALLVMRLTLRWGFSRGAALFAATAYGIASPAWCYATLFMEHGLTAGCLMLAYVSAVDLDWRETLPVNRGARPATPDPRMRRYAWTLGAWTGLAVLSELQAAVPASFIVLLALAYARDRGWRAAAVTATRIVAGGLLAGTVLLTHNALAFGSPLHVGYGVADSPIGQLHAGFFGITRPTWWRLREILIGSYRGLLPLSPLIAVTPIGLVMLARMPGRRRAAFVAAAVAAFYLFFNASYYYWEGGWAYAPRQMMPALPFLALGLAPLWDTWTRWGRIVLSAGWLWGAALTLIAVSTTPQPPAPDLQAPVRELLWPAFKDGDLSLNNQSFVTYRARSDLLRGHRELHAAWNLGELAGLEGLPSLLPLGLVWLVAALVLLL